MELLNKPRRASKGTWYLFAALLLAARAAGAVGFTGRVIDDASGSGLNGVQVQVINPANDSVVGSGNTNPFGYYTIPMAAGTYHVQVGPAGYFPALRSSHTVTAGDITVDFALQASGEVFRDDCSVNLWSMVSKPSAGSFTSNGNVCDYFSDFPTNTAGNVYDWFDRGGLNIPYAGNFVTLRHRMQMISGAPIQGSQLFFNTWNFTGVLVWNNDLQWEELSYTLGSRTNNANLTAFQFVNDPADLIVPPSQWHSYIDYILIHSRDRGFVSGAVKNLAGTPLPYSRVQVRRGAAVVGEGLSDAAGNYTVWVATDGPVYDVYFSTNGTAEFRQSGVAVAGRAQTTVNVSIDTAPPAAVSSLAFNEFGANSARLTWMAPGDDGWSGQLNASSFTIQYSTDPLQAWAPQLAQINISTGGVNPFMMQAFTVFGLPANSTNYFRLWTRDAYGNFSGLSNGATVTTLIEPPQSVYIDEVSSWSVTASAYASTFTNLGAGLAAVNIATGTGYGVWPATGNAWFQSADMVNFRQGAAGAALGGKIYLMGGAPDAVSYTAVVEEYDPVLNSWSSKIPMPTARSGLAAAAAGGKIYAIGGKNSGGVNGTVEEYDPVTGMWTTRAPMPTARDRLAAAAMRGLIYAVGGADGAGTILDKNEAYDPAYDKWETRQPLPQPRRNQAAAAAEDRLYVSGGYNVGASAELLRYDQWSNTWNPLPPMNKARYGHALAAVGGKLFAAAGHNGASHVTETEVFDLKNSFWASAAPIPAQREGAGAAVLRGNIYLAGGNDGAYLKTAYRYEPGVSVTFKGLNPNRQYWFRAKARNQNGAETGETVSFSTYTLAVATSPLPGQPVFTGLGYSSVAVHWSSGTQLTGFNDWGARYEVQLATSPQFNGYGTKWYSSMAPDFIANDLQAKTTYYARVRAFNNGGYTDYSWTLLGSTRTEPAPLGGVVISSVTPHNPVENPNWSRATVRDSQGVLYHAYLKNYFGRSRVFLSRSVDNGRNWADTTAAPVETAGDVPSANSYSQGAPALAIDSKDVLHLVWGGANNVLDAVAGVESKCVYSSAPVPGAMWSPHVKIPAHSHGGVESGFNIAVDGNDGLHVTWTGQDCATGPDCYQIRYSSRAAADSVWLTFEEPNYDGKLAASPAIAVDSKNAVHMVARHAATAGPGATPLILYSSRSAAGWAPWTLVYNSGNDIFPQGDPSLTIDSNGRLFAAWSGTDGGNTNPQIKYSIMPPGGAWSAMQHVGVEPAAPQRNPTAAADAIGKVYVLWSGSDTVNSAINLKGSDYDGAAWKAIDKLTDETTGQQLYPALRWSGWRNNGGGIDVLWQSYDGSASTAVLRQMQGADVPMSAGWTKTVWPKPAECGYTLNVRQDGTGDFSGLQQAVGALPTEISTPSCVVVRDTETYPEQVTVQGFRIRAWDFPAARIFIMRDPTFISSSPVVSPPAISTAAFQIMTDSVSVAGFNIVPTAPLPYGVLASSDMAVISSVNVISGGKIWQAGVRISSYSAVRDSSVTVQAAYGVLLYESRFSEVRRSTVASDSLLHNGVRLWLATDNILADNVVSNPKSFALFLGAGSSFNAVKGSTVTGGGNDSALALSFSNYNTLEDNYIYNPTGSGAGLFGNSSENTVRRSTMAAAAPGFSAFGFFSGTSSNTITASVVLNSQGDGLVINGASSNTVSHVSATGAGLGSSGLLFYNAAGNTVTRSLLSAPHGTGATSDYFSAGNNISFSSAAGGAFGGMFVRNSSYTLIDDCYLQGPASGLEIMGSTATIMRGSVAVSTNSDGIAYTEWSGSSGVYIASSTLVAGATGYGAWFDAYNGGKTEIASTTVRGGNYGVQLSTPGAGASLYISSLTFRGLAAGATAFSFVGGYYGFTEIRGAYFDSPGMAVNVDARRLISGTTLQMSYPAGKWGAVYEADPYNFVRWPTAGAVLLSPAAAAGFLPPAAALRARPEFGASSAKYNFQVDSWPSMDSMGMNTPRYNFDQTQAQRFPSQGAFSGQDSTMTAPGDAFLFTSTASFVFFSTHTNLSQNTTYYWRARALTAEAGEYGQWSSTRSFTVGEPAALAQANDLQVGNVSLSTPTGNIVSINLTLRENNVLNGVTPGGGAYNTADWIFVKFSTQAGADGTWNHATLTGGTVGGGVVISAASDNKGVFLDHTSVFPLWTSPVTLNWNYAADGVTGARARVKVFAVSMVKVPTGIFVYNAGGIDAGGGYNSYGNGSQMTVVGSGQLPAGAAGGWPNGYSSFYIMRYELTQGQYADFLNTVHSSTAAALHDVNTDYGHNIQYLAGNAYGYRYVAMDRFAAKNYLSTSDAWSFLSWAGLRPMTEMEYEKACRDLNSTAAYPWGNSDPDAATYSPPNEGGTHSRNYLNYGYVTGGLKVLDAGRYLSGDVYRTAEQTGASPYGIADLAGNVSELVINCSHTAVPGNGNGTVEWPASWPAPGSTGKGLRGSNWTFGAASYFKVSDRSYAAWSNAGRTSYTGVRGVRAP